MRVSDGHWRKQDVHRWEAVARRGGLPADLWSWDKVTDCARRGIVVLADERGGFGSFGVHAVGR